MDADKVGVVLSVKREKISPSLEGKFINVLHSDLVRHIRKKGITPLDATADFYLNEFLAALDNLTQHIDMNPEIAFYFDNVAQCNRIYGITEKALQYIVSHIQQAGAKKPSVTGYIML